MALVAAICLAICCGQAYASENEAEMAGGFAPAGLSSRTVSNRPSDMKANQAVRQAGNTSQESNGTQGIPMDDGSIVAVDGERHLVLAGSEGDARVLDESRTYAVETLRDGELVMRDDAGEEALVEGATVSFADAKGKRAVVEAVASGAKAGDSASAPGAKEAEMSGGLELSEGVADVPDEPASSVTSASGANAGAVAVAAVIAVAAAVGIVLWRRKTPAPSPLEK